MEVGCLEIVRSVNRSWIYGSYFSLYTPIHPGGISRGKISRGGKLSECQTCDLLDAEPPLPRQCRCQCSFNSYFPLQPAHIQTFTQNMLFHHGLTMYVLVDHVPVSFWIPFTYHGTNFGVTLCEWISLQKHVVCLNLAHDISGAIL